MHPKVLGCACGVRVEAPISGQRVHIVWQARRQGATVGAAYVLGVGLLLYLNMDVRSNVVIFVCRDSGDDIFIMAAGYQEALKTSPKQT